MKAEEEQLAGSGRILVRPSGTEALMRVMVEAKTEDAARQTAQEKVQGDRRFPIMMFHYALPPKSGM